MKKGLDRQRKESLTGGPSIHYALQHSHRRSSSDGTLSIHRRRLVVSSPEDEFSSPLRVYHSTKDANGDRRFTRLVLPAELVSELERFIRDNGTYLSLHQMLLNAVHYGLDTMQHHGMAPDEPIFNHVLEAEHLLAKQEARVKLHTALKEAWRNAESPDERAIVSAQIRATATTTGDSVYAHQLRQILE
jgi:hypothetical protein